MNNIKYRIGETNVNNQGLKMEIIAYRKSVDIDVILEDGYVAYNKKYENFKNGSIRSYLQPTVCGVGILGAEKISKNRKAEKPYTIWHTMITRCYSDKYHSRRHTYKDCSVCEEWLYYPNFKKWFNENYYEIDDETMALDKDILVKGNKIYSPNTCCFVPKYINNIFVNKNKGRNSHIGIRKEDKTYTIVLTIYSNQKTMRGFATMEEAFLKYKELKEKYIKEIADIYKNKIPSKLYESMYKWEVEITD